MRQSHLKVNPWHLKSFIAQDLFSLDNLLFFARKNLLVVELLFIKLTENKFSQFNLSMSLDYIKWSGY